MKNPRFFLPGRGLVLAAAGSLLLAGCGHKDPETVGKQMADYLCESANQGEAALYAREQRLVAEMKAGTIKTRTQYRDRSMALFKPIEHDDSLRGVKIKTLLAELDADFPQREERQAAGQVITQYMGQCEAAQKARQKQQPPTQLAQLRAQLTGPAPESAPVYTPEGELVPPPPNLTVDTTRYQ